MFRAKSSSALGLIVLATFVVLRSDSRGDGPTKGATAPIKATLPKQTEITAPLPAKPATGAIGETAVQRALDQTGDFDFVDEPLKDIADFIAAHYKINVRFDTESLANMGITPDTTITESLKAVPLRAFLHIGLGSKDVAYVERGDNVLLITTAEMARSRVVLRVYEVRDLTDPRNEFLAEPNSWERLQELVTATVAPQSWDSQGGRGSLSVVDGSLIVSQTEEVHSQVAELLTGLEAARAQDATLPRNSGALEYPAPSATRLRIDRSLESRLDFDFVDTPLKDIVSAVQSRIGLPLELDAKAMTDAGLSPATTFSISLKQVRARIGLWELLAVKNLTFVVDDEILLITTSDLAKARTETAVYPVGDLVSGDESIVQGRTDYDTLVAAIEGTVAPQSWIGDGGAGTVLPFPASKALVVSQSQEMQHEVRDLLAALREVRRKPPEAAAVSSGSPVVRIYLSAAVDEKASPQVIDLVRKFVEPKSWSEPDAYISYFGSAIIVRQTQDVQLKIRKFLNALNGHDSRTEFPGFGNS